jgi:probable rRNA maturation factor
MGFSLTNKTKSTFGPKDSVLFANLKDRILGKNYELSLVFIGKSKSKELNNKFRQKNKPTNVLSFTLSENSGEIFITPEVAKVEYKKFEGFEKSLKKFIIFLFIHGCLHLKGMDHGSTMERAEKKWLAISQLE